MYEVVVKRAIQELYSLWFPVSFLSISTLTGDREAMMPPHYRFLEDEV
jgi:hypothetical protein